MGLKFFKTVRNSIKYWYLPLIAGIVLIAAGIWTFTEPEDSYVALAFLFSLSFFVTGFVESIFSIVNRDVIDNWGWNLALGLLTLVIGVLMLLKPEVSQLTLPFYVGFVILFRSMNAIGLSLDLKSYGILDWGNLLAVGILGMILAFILLWNPLFAGLSVVVWTGIALVFAGIFSIMASLKLKKLHDVPKKVSKELHQRLKDLQNEIIKELDSEQN